MTRVTSEQPLQVHRLGFGLLLAWFFATVGVVAVGSGLLATSAPVGQRLSSVLAGVAVLCGCWVLGFRPVVAEEPTRVLVRNPLRDAVVPWGAVTGVLLRDVVVLDTPVGEVRCYALPRRGRPPLQSRPPPP